jgi:undecaprenyl diphosphate synthase
MEILRLGLQEERPEFIREGIKVVFFGDRSRLSEEVIREMELTEEATKFNDKLSLAFAINYSGRDDIVRAVRRIAIKIASKEINIEDIDDRLISQELDTRDFPDPDLVIRTSGELRISNFLLWQSAYSEFYFTPRFWPDFDEKEFDSAIEAYTHRERRFGGI